MASSSVKALKTLEEGCVIYTGLIGNASTGKSPALNLIKRSVGSVEKFIKVPEVESRFLNGKYIKDKQ